MSRRTRALATAAVLLPVPISALLPVAAAAQLEIGGYALGVGSYAAESDLLPAGATWFGRGRLMADYERGWLTFEAAYEHVLQRQPAGGGFGITNPGGQRISTDWLPLDWTIHESGRGSWRHRFDRLALQASRGPVVVTVGRQAISWATTLFLTPADPFAPFDPSDPFREYRGGVDAIRVHGFSGPFTELEAVGRLAETSSGTTVTALGRVATSRGAWAFGTWAGLLHDELAAALFVTGGLGATSLRTEVAFREDPSGGALVRSSVGFDRNYQVSGKDLYAIVEVQYDGFGAATPDELLAVAQSEAFGRGDMQVLGQWTAAAQASYQVHPLIGIDALTLVNLRDPSFLFAPGASWATTSSASTRLGVFFGVGDGATPGAPLPTLGSEYGLVPPLGYLSVSFYF
jgi:hypothetical protein